MIHFSPTCFSDNGECGKLRAKPTNAFTFAGLICKQGQNYLSDVIISNRRSLRSPYLGLHRSPYLGLHRSP